MERLSSSAGVIDWEPFKRRAAADRTIRLRCRTGKRADAGDGGAPTYRNHLPATGPIVEPRWMGRGDRE
jgi:hypothetical protein